MTTISVAGRTFERFSRAHALAMLLAFGASLYAGRAWPAALIGALSLGAWAARQRGRWTPGGQFGAANALTALRLALILGLVPVSAPSPGKVAASLALGVFALDGVDGFIARRRGEVSAFGAHFDLEVDALFVLVGSLLLYQHERLGAFILAAGLLRYVYVLLLAVVPAAGETPRSRLGRHGFSAIAVALCAGLWPLAPVYRQLSVAALALLAVSFATSLRSAFRRA
jgi:phosphatidylglycerophosphate synthase